MTLLHPELSKTAYRLDFAVFGPACYGVSSGLWDHAAGSR